MMKLGTLGLASAFTLVSYATYAEDGAPDAGADAAAFVCAYAHPDSERQTVDLAQAVWDKARPIDETAIQTTELTEARPLPGMMRQTALLLECNMPPIPPPCGRDPDGSCYLKRRADTSIPLIERAKELVTQLRAEADRLDPLVAGEAACRASDKCMGDRMCALVADRRDVYRQIATEKANPAGVVDLVRLHTLGEEAQSVEATIKVMATWYQAARKKPWREACR